MHAKAERLEQELKKEREDRDALEKNHSEQIQALHLQMATLSEEKDDMKKRLAVTKNELKGTLPLFLLCP